MTCRLGDGKHDIVRQRVRASARAVRPIWNPRLFQTETRFVADGRCVGASFEAAIMRVWIAGWTHTMHHAPGAEIVFIT